MQKLIAASLLATFALTTPLQAADETKETCRKVRLSDLGWTDLALTNATASLLLTALGYEPEQTLLGLNVTYEMMKAGEIDAFLGNWRPVQDEQFKSYFEQGDVEVINTNLTGAKFTLAVPTYVAQQGVRSFDDLARHADKFGTAIYGIEAGSNEPLLAMIEAKRHGLGDWQVVESSEIAMLTQVEKMTKKNEWVVFLAWQPHPMNLKFDLTYLSGGDEEYGPNYGGASVRTLVRRGYREQCPNVAKLLTNLKFDVDFENVGMDLIANQGLTATDAAKKLIANHPDRLRTWLADVRTIDGTSGFEAAASKLTAGH